MKKFIVTLALVGCSGAFSSIGDPSDSGADALDVGSSPLDGSGSSSGGEGGTDAAWDTITTPESGSGGEAAMNEASPVESGPPCCAAPTAACSYALGSCPIASENHGSFPTSFEVDGVPANSECSTVTTPTQCLCDYTCACVEPTYHCPQGTTMSCSNDPVQGLLITCSI